MHDPSQRCTVEHVSPTSSKEHTVTTNLMTRSEAANFLGVTPDVIDSLASDGTIPCGKVGDTPVSVFRAEDVHRAIRFAATRSDIVVGTIEDWAAETLDRSAVESIQTSDLYAAYSKAMQANGSAPVSLREFSSTMMSLGYQRTLHSRTRRSHLMVTPKAL